MSKSFKINGVGFGDRYPITLIAGPCVIENKKTTIDIAKKLVHISNQLNIPLVFKASYDKANRTSLESYRGPGVEEGLEILKNIKDKFNVPLLTDVHNIDEIKKASKIVDIIQIPAFLTRQTDFIIAAGESGCAINIKKAQFAAPWDMKQVVKKIESTGNRKILLTERGTTFGYNTLVSDMRSLVIMRELGYPIIFDATHSVQTPGGKGNSSGGDGRFAPYLAKAATAVGINGLFIETHPNPDLALSDGPNMIPLNQMTKLWKKIKAIDSVN